MTKSRSVALLGGLVPPRVKFAPQSRDNSADDVSDLVAAFGLILDPWQEEVLRAGLGERSNGNWAARQIGLSTPRQNGKTEIIVARVLAGLLLFGEKTIVVSAHRQDTARETFFRLVNIIESNPALEERVDFIARSEMREYIRMKSGQEVRFKARSGTSGRGFSCDCLMLDEAQDLGAAAWAAILPTMSARPNPQVWLLGTPPTSQTDGEVFGRIRAAGLGKQEPHLAWLEWAAEPEDDFDAEETWAKANPAYGIRIGPEAIMAERASMSDSQFAMERLGIWAGAVSRSVIPSQSWAEAGDEHSMAIEDIALGVEVAPDLVSASVCLAGRRPDGSWHVELDEQREGSDWVVPYVRGLVDANPGLRAVVIDAGSPTAALTDAFKAAHVRVTYPKVTELGQACMRLLDGVVTGQVWHTRQPQLTLAVSSAGKRRLGDTGMWVWSRASTASDITPVQAVTLALWAAQTKTVKRPAGRTSSGRAGVVL